jgi:hypothetical protein
VFELTLDVLMPWFLFGSLQRSVNEEIQSVQAGFSVALRRFAQPVLTSPGFAL